MEARLRAAIATLPLTGEGGPRLGTLTGGGVHMAPFSRGRGGTGRKGTGAGHPGSHAASGTGRETSKACDRKIKEKAGLTWVVVGMVGLSVVMTATDSHTLTHTNTEKTRTDTFSLSFGTREVQIWVVCDAAGKFRGKSFPF